MALYRVEAPNGKTYEVTAPSGTKMEDIYDYVQVEFLDQEQSSSTPDTSGLGASDPHSLRYYMDNDTPMGERGRPEGYEAPVDAPTPTSGLSGTAPTPTSGLSGTAPTPTSGLSGTTPTPAPTPTDEGLSSTAESTIKDQTSIIPKTDYAFDDGTPMFLTDGGMATVSWAEEANKIQAQIDSGETVDYLDRKLTDRLEFAKSQIPEEAYFSEAPSLLDKTEAVAKNFASGFVTNQSMLAKGQEINLFEDDYNKLQSLYATRAKGDTGKGLGHSYVGDNGLISLVDAEGLDAKIAELEAKTSNVNSYFDLSNWVKTLGPDTTQLDPRTDTFWQKDVPSGLGQASSYIANQALLSKLTKGRGGQAANFAGIAAQGSMVNRTASFEDALNHDASLEDAFAAGDIGAIIGTTEAVPLASMLNRIDNGTGGSLRSTLRKMLAEGTEEALQETFQTIMNNLTASEFVKYDPERKMFVGVKEGAETGFTVGSILSVVTSLYSGRKMRNLSNQMNEDVDNKDATGVIEKGVVDILDPNVNANTVDPSQPAIDTSVDAHLNPVVVGPETDKYGEGQEMPSDSQLEAWRQRDNYTGSLDDYKRHFLQGVEASTDEKRLELRNKHAKTFPNEKEWIKANREVVYNQQRAEVNDPNTELGKQFLAWKNDPDVAVSGMHDTDEDGNPTEEAFKAFLKDNIVRPKQAEEHAAYVAALDAHGVEQEANPTPQAVETTEETDDPYGFKFRAEQEGVTEEEWIINNLESISKESPEIQAKVKDDINKKQQRLAELQGETNENAEEFPNNPFIGTKKKVRKASWDKAAKKLGEDFEANHDGLSQLIHNDKSYSSKGFDKALDAIVSAQAEEKAATNTEDKGANTEDKGLSAKGTNTEEMGLSVKDDDASDLVEASFFNGDINWNPTGKSKNRPKLVKWFSKVLEEGTLDNFLDKKGDFMNSEVVKAAGLNKSDDVTYNKKTVAAMLAEHYGYKDADSFAKDFRENLAKKYPSLEVNQSDVATALSNTVSSEDDANSGVIDPRKLIEDEIDQSKTVTAGGSKGEVFALSKEEENWVGEKATAEEKAVNKKLEAYRKRGDKLRLNNASVEEWASFNQELADLVVKHPELKQIVLSELALSARRNSVINNKKEKAVASALWDSTKGEGVVSYNDLSDGAKYDWHLSIDEYTVSKDKNKLLKDVNEISNNTYPTLLGDNNAQNKQKLPTKSSKETKGLGQSSTEGQGSGSTAVANNGKNTPKPRTKKYTKKQQAAIAYAEEHIGRDWETSRKRLVPLLKKRDLKDFYAFVDKVAGVDAKSDSNKRREEFASRDAAEKSSPVKTTKKAELNKTEARKYAREVLGKYWRRDNPELVAMVGSKDFDALDFQRSLNEILDSKTDEGKPQFAFHDGMQRSKDSPYKVTHEDVEGFVAELMGRDKATARDMRRIHVFQSHAELSDSIIHGGILGDTVAKEEIESITKKGAYIHGSGVAFVRGVNGQKHAFFILDEMDMISDQMSVAGIFVHEVGVHMGMQSLMGGKATAKLAGTIRSWAARNDGSIEQKVALDVEARIEFIQEMHKANGDAPMTQDAIDSETVAYAVQFGVENYGINPLTAKPVPKNSLRGLIKTAFSTLKKFMNDLTGGNAKSITIENLVDAAYGAARLEINKTYHVSTTKTIGDVDLTYSGSGLDGAVNGFGFNITDRFGSAGAYAKEVIKKASKPVKLKSLLDSSKNKGIKSLAPDLSAKLEKLIGTGAYLLNGKKWKPLNWGLFEFTYTKGGEGGHTVTIVHTKSGDSTDVALELRDRDGARVFSREEVATLGVMVDHLKGTPQVYTHMVDVLVTDEELMDLDNPIGLQPFVMDFVNSMSIELQELIVAENDEGASLDEMSGRALYETLFLIEGGHTKKGDKGYQLINELADTHKVTHDDLKVANQIEGEMRHSAKIAAIMDKAGIKGNRTVDLTEPGGAPSELDALADRSLRAAFSRKSRVAQGSIADEEGSSRDSKVIEGTYNKVIFNEDNIIVSGAIRMTDAGGKMHDIPLSKKKDYVRFSIKNERNHKDRRNTRKIIKATLGKNAAYQWDTLASFAKDAAESLDFLSSLIYKHRFDLPTAVDVEKIFRDKDVMRNELVSSVESIAVQAREMSFERRQLVNSFIQKATVEQIWPADPNIVGRTVTVDKDFHKEFTEVLSEAEQKAVMDVFKHGHDMAIMLKDLSVELGIDSEFLGFTQMEGPYAPLMRFGKYVVEFKSKSVIDAEEQLKKGGLPPYREKLLAQKLEKLKTNDKYYEISFHHTEGEANKYKDANGGRYATSTVSPKAESVSEGRVPDVKVLEKVYGAMKTLDLDPEAKVAFESMLEGMYHSALEDANARHSQTRRKGYAGYNDNMLFNFVEHAKAEANLATTLKYGKDINVTLAEMTAQAKESKNPSVMRLHNAVIKHYTLSLAKGETRIADAILAYNSFSLLTSSFGYHLQNATQTFAVAHPMLSGTFGNWNEVRNDILGGYHVAFDIVSYDSKVPFVGSKKVTWQTYIDVDAAPSKYVGLLTRIQGMGQLDVGVEEDLSSLKETNTGFKAFDATSRGASTISHRAYQVPRLVESYNRISTAIAAFDLATKHPEAIKHMGLTPEEFAVKIVQDTQGDFSATGAPQLFKSLGKNPVGKVAIQFRKFSVMMMWAYARSTFQAFKGATKQEKIIGARTVAFLLMHTAVFSGIRGLPAIAKFTAIYLLLTGMFGEDDEEPKNTKGYIERMVDENVDNKTVATMINRGVLSALGVDASIKLSHAGIFDLVPFGDFDLSLDGLMEYVYGVFGPTGGQVANVVRGAEFAKDDNYYRALESVSPKGIKTAMESYRLGTEGYTDSAGTPVAGPKNFDVVPLIANALGIPVSQVSNLKWTRGEQYEIREYFTRRQQEITGDHRRASKAKDQEARRKAEKAWYKLQDAKDNTRPFFNNAPSALKRTPITVLLKAGDRDWKKQQKIEDELGTR